MQKKISDYIHLYIGGEVAHPSDKCPFKLIGINHDGEPIIQGDFSGGTHNVNQISFVPIEDIKLILRPLSDMTREEAEFINNGSIMPDDELKEYGYYNEYAEGCPAYQYIRYEDYGSVQRLADQMGNPSAWHFLLKQGFDLFGLIEAGLAIDKTKL
jgi:hypothetical protein